jgi:hypothetical protein
MPPTLAGKICVARAEQMLLLTGGPERLLSRRSEDQSSRVAAHHRAGAEQDYWVQVAFHRIVSKP